MAGFATGAMGTGPRVAAVAATAVAGFVILMWNWNWDELSDGDLFERQKRGRWFENRDGVWGWLHRSLFSREQLSSASRKGSDRRDGLIGMIGNTPLVRIRSLSDATGCEILGKAEFLNPGGSVKDRVALKIIEEALQSGALRVGGVITEGSAGSTAVSLAMVASAHGCKCHVVIPDDAAVEKAQILKALGATVERVRPVSITHRNHFVNIARRRALEARSITSGESSPRVQRDDSGFETVANGLTVEDSTGSNTSHATAKFQDSVEKQEEQSSTRGNCSSGSRGEGSYFADQFENLANFRAHYEGTGPEIWRQSGGNVHAFVAAAGTGGTIAGVSCFLKEQDPKIKSFLIDPPGSGLYNRVTRGVMYSQEEAEGKRLRNPFDTITEGIGINRLTENFKLAQLDGALRGTDAEAVEMSRYLLKNDGLFLGSSSAMNCVGAVRVARMLGPGHTIVTILCDGGNRHLSKFQNLDYLAANGLSPTAAGLEFLDPS